MEGELIHTLTLEKYQEGIPGAGVRREWRDFFTIVRCRKIRESKICNRIALLTIGLGLRECDRGFVFQFDFG